MSSQKKDSYPLPRIDDTLDTLSKKHQWFSTMNLKSAYWQVEIHPDDRDPDEREMTVFYYARRTLKVMPFEFDNPPSTFKRLLETVLRGFSCEAFLV